MNTEEDQHKNLRHQAQANHQKQNAEHVYTPVYCLLGDVGGTNLRLQLVKIQPPLNQPLQLVHKHTYAVLEQQIFQASIRHFLSKIPQQKYPEIGIIGMAGPVQDNKVFLSNVPKWGILSGEALGKSLKIRHFQFLNDFIANSHGITTLSEDQFISLNGLNINPRNTRGVMGPGTGLGNSVMVTFPFRKRERLYVLPSEGGHCDSPYINDTISQYYKFIGQKLNVKAVGLEYSFCGPAIPYMYQFFAHKYPNYEGADRHPTSKEIVQKYMSNRQVDTLQKKTVDLFIELYCSAICNFAISHMCTGGMYLVGSLTLAVLDRLRQTNLIQKFKQRHPQMSQVIEKIPIVVAKQVDLGLRGAYAKARRIIADEQHP